MINRILRKDFTSADLVITMRFFAIFTAFFLLLTGCGGAAPVAVSQPSEAASEPPEPIPEPEQPIDYMAQVADELIEANIAPELSQTEKARWAFEHLIETTVIDQPLGLDIWRYRGGEGNRPDYIANRALSPLVFGIGSCEDYAAALVYLLRRMGMEAEYVPGLTVSAQGGFVDHAWVMAEIEGIWYHLDPHLEDTILKDNTLVYKYFMKSDRTMLASHRWGENLLAFGALTPAQEAEIRSGTRFPSCPVDGPAPPFQLLSPAPAPDREALEAAISLEKEQYEQQHGSLPPLELDLLPPVFRGDTYPLSK